LLFVLEHVVNDFFAINLLKKNLHNMYEPGGLDTMQRASGFNIELFDMIS